VAREYPDVKFEEAMIDHHLDELVMAPQQYDVVAPPTVRDILTDIGAGLVGGLGLAPGLCVGKTSDGAGDPRARRRHRRAKLAKPLRYDHVGQSLLAWLGAARRAKASARAQRIETPWRGRSSRKAPDPRPRGRRAPKNGRCNHRACQ